MTAIVIAVDVMHMVGIRMRAMRCGARADIVAVRMRMMTTTPPLGSLPGARRATGYRGSSMYCVKKGERRLRCDDPVRRLSDVFDALAKNPETDVSRILWCGKEP